jgi:hypothetical protein
MCDYSLNNVASRAANVGDKLVVTDFAKTITSGFAAVGEPDVAVCLLPGTELAFQDYVQYHRALSRFGKARVNHKVARFRQVDLDNPHVHHDALEFPGGQIVMVTRLVAGQRVTVLQLPVRPIKGLRQSHKSAPLTSVKIGRAVKAGQGVRLLANASIV